MDHVGSRAGWGKIGLAAGAAVLASAGWYTAWGNRLARLDEVYAQDGPPPGWVLPVELARSATVATAVAVLADATGRRRPSDTIRLGLGLWAAFPAVLLTGSVVHEEVPWQQAAIHAGDWLTKLLLISLVVGGGRTRR
jgi:Protein of unknown function (DUF1761)